jgi:hypothetical protein
MEKEKQFSIPILIILFNRIDTLQVLFNVIRSRKPKYLYVYGDGPRIQIPGEKEKCEQARNIINQIDWDCEVVTNFKEQNSGSAAISVSTAISWFFEQVEYGIIFEHDTIPHPDYFIFCEELLEKYKDDERISRICGVNFQDGITRGDGSYYFSRKGTSTWGSATWRRFWKHYDIFLDDYPCNVFSKDMKDCKISWKETLMDKDRYKLIKERKLDDWTYQTGFAQRKLHGLAIIPNVNMIKNIGGGPQAYTYKDNNNWRLNRDIFPILPLKHPSIVERDIEADEYQSKNVELRPSMLIPVINKSIRLNVNSLFLFLLYISWRKIRRIFVKSKFSTQNHSKENQKLH